MPRALLIAALVSLLTGCGTLKGTFENRLTTTLAGDRVFITSLYGPVGITTELSADDAAELKRMAEAKQQAEQLMLAMRLQNALQPAK